MCGTSGDQQLRRLLVRVSSRPARDTRPIPPLEASSKLRSKGAYRGTDLRCVGTGSNVYDRPMKNPPKRACRDANRGIQRSTPESASVVATPSTSAGCPPLPKYGDADQGDKRGQCEKHQEFHLGTSQFLGRGNIPTATWLALADARCSFPAKTSTAGAWADPQLCG